MPKPVIIDLFCGCGGFGLGAEQAGFRSGVAVDIDETLQSAYRRNFPTAQSVIADAAALDREAWAFILNNQSVDGIIGGPPCQGFSRIGKHERDDPRRTLLGHFFRTVSLLRPKFFVMENVEGLLDDENAAVLDAAIEGVAGTYTILGPLLVNARDYGAPTSRKRVVVIGYDKNEVDALTCEDFSGFRGEEAPTVADAIRDLSPPVPQKKGPSEFGWARYPDANSSGPDLSSYARQMRRLPGDNLGWDVALRKLANGSTSGNFGTAHTTDVVQRFRAALPGHTEPVSRYPRLDWSGYCPTLRAGTGADRGSFQAMRPIHPGEPRVITVREAARLQGFPDWFAFHPTKWHSFRMIGNSVSPLMGKALLGAILPKLYYQREGRVTAQPA